MVSGVTLTIRECKSVLNMVAFGGVLMARESSSVYTGSSKFYRPCPAPCGMVGSYDTTQMLWNSTFHALRILLTKSQILSRGNSTTLIHDCSFVDDNRIPGYTINLKIEDFTKLTVTNSFFRTRVGFATVALFATGNSHATLKNSTFKKSVGLLYLIKQVFSFKIALFQIASAHYMGPVLYLCTMVANSQ